MKENVILYGTFHINENIVVTIDRVNKETICGYGNKSIMDAAFRSKLYFKKFKESDFIKNKSIQYINSIPVNNDNLIIYTINENKKKKKISNKNQISLKPSLNDNNNDKISLAEEKKEETQIHSGESDISKSENNANISSNNNIKALNNILEKTNSQTSAITKYSGNSFWNLNKGIARYDKNNFSSKFDNDNHFKNLFSTKIEQLESIVYIYIKNPISYINDINKICVKYKNLLNIKKRNELRLNMN